MAFLGRDCTLDILLAKDLRQKVGGAIPRPNQASYVRLGGGQGLEYSSSWDSTDVTSRSSRGIVRENLVTYLALTGSTDGIYLPEASSNIEAVESYTFNPPSRQPYCWIRLTKPSGTAGVKAVEEVYCLLTEFSFSAPNDDAATFSISWQGQQAPIKSTLSAEDGFLDQFGSIYSTSELFNDAELFG